MRHQNNSRIGESGDILSTGSTGFTVRKRTGIGLFFHIFLLACMVMLGAALLAYYRSPAGCLLAVAIGLCFGLIAHNLEKHKKGKEALEFMNALFSSALSKGYRCYFIVKDSGDIVFYNRPFQAVFPDYIGQHTRTLKALAELYHLPPADRDKLLGFLSTNAQGALTTAIRSSAATDAQTITFEIEPIERPTGFFLIRGK